VAVELALDNCGLRHPVQLHHPTLADIWAMSVKRAGAAAKCQHGPGERHDFPHIILDIIRTAQQPQTAPGTIPRSVQIEQQCDDLALRIGMYAPVLAVTSAADRYQSRTVLEVEREFLLDRAAQLRSGQGGNQPRKGGAACQALDWETAVTGNMREIGDDRAKLVAAHEIFNDDKLERVAAQRLRP
jgi:hypothetical protein